jgi:hypothetical protein
LATERSPDLPAAGNSLAAREIVRGGKALLDPAIASRAPGIEANRCRERAAGNLAPKAREGLPPVVIEHHLFPDLLSNRYQEIAPQIQELFMRYGLTYASGPLPKQVASASKKVFRLALPNPKKPMVPSRPWHPRLTIATSFPSHSLSQPESAGPDALQFRRGPREATDERQVAAGINGCHTRPCTGPGATMSRRSAPRAPMCGAVCLSRSVESRAGGR